jgi:hypothetical protein
MSWARPCCRPCLWCRRLPLPATCCDHEGTCCDHEADAAASDMLAVIMRCAVIVWRSLIMRPSLQAACSEVHQQHAHIHCRTRTHKDPRTCTATPCIMQPHRALQCRDSFCLLAPPIFGVLSTRSVAVLSTHSVACFTTLPVAECKAFLDEMHELSHLPKGPQSKQSPANPVELGCINLGQLPIRRRHVLPCTRLFGDK